VLAGSGLVARELADRGDSLLLLLYSPDAMAALLQRPAAAGLLRRSGYGPLDDTDAALGELASRCGGSGFPHEIGVFLGYPLKDVAAFMGWVQLPFACQTLWKIYGDPRPSLELAETFLCCRRRMSRQLASCSDPLACLSAASSFLSPVNEKENQNPMSPCASH
jgi:hypothetical protein